MKKAAFTLLEATIVIFAIAVVIGVIQAGKKMVSKSSALATLNQADNAWEANLGEAGIENGSSSSSTGVCSSETVDTADTTTISGETILIFTTTGAHILDCSEDVTAEILVVAAGGGSTTYDSTDSKFGTGGSGGGGVGHIENHNLTAGQYNLYVGAGVLGDTGENSNFGDTLIIANGGGKGGVTDAGGRAGGSGGGVGRRANDSNDYPGSATRGSTTIGASLYGNSGGTSPPGGIYDRIGAGGGGGAGSSGSNGAKGNASSERGGNGGAGRAFDITGTSIYYAGGGGGASSGTGGTGGTGGGGAGSSTYRVAGEDGTDGLGGGAGGSNADTGRIRNTGGSGVVIVRFINP